MVLSANAVEVVLRPRLCALSQSRDSRVFQGLSVPDIVTGVLQQHGIGSDSQVWRLEQEYAVLPYTVQFQETDLALVERLLSQAGIAYWCVAQEGRDVGIRAVLLRAANANAHASAWLARIASSPRPPTKRKSSVRMGFFVWAGIARHALPRELIEAPAR